MKASVVVLGLVLAVDAANDLSTPVCMQGDTLCGDKCMTSSILHCVEGQCSLNTLDPKYEELLNEQGLAGLDKALEEHCQNPPYLCHATNETGACTNISFLCGGNYCDGQEEGCMYVSSETDDIPEPGEGMGCEHLEDRCEIYQGDVAAICQDETWFRYFPDGCSTPDCQNWAFPKYLCGKVNCFPRTVNGEPVEEGVDVLDIVSSSWRSLLWASIAGNVLVTLTL